MTSTNPRDFRDWMRTVERQGVQLRGIPAMITQAVEAVGTAPADTSRHPAAPVELTYQTAFYTDTSFRRRVRFLMDFPDVVFNTDGTPAVIAQYELWAKEETLSALDILTSAVPGLALPGSTLPSLANTESNAALAVQQRPWVLQDTSLESFFRTDGFIPGTVWRFRARAIGASAVTPGEWSQEIVVQMLEDSTPPPQPTAPTILVQRGTITVSWDGQSVNGPMPADFKYAVLAHGTTSSPTAEVARFGRVGGFKVITDVEYYDPQFFRLQAIDESGNAGPWSEQGVGYTTPLVDADIILSTLDAAKTHLINVDAGVSILPNTIITEHLLVTGEMSAAIGNFLYLNADKIDVNSLAADEVFTGLLDAVLVRADMFEGKAFVGGVFTTSFGGKFQTDVEDLVGVKLTAKGLDAWSDSGVHTLTFDTATGNLSIFGGTFTGGKFQSSPFANTGVKLDTNGLKIWNTSNQLTLDATPNGSTFTGTVRSGFGSSSATLSENLWEGRPGLSLKAGGSYGADAFVIGYAANDAYEYRRGSIYVSAAWNNPQSSDPGRLFMERNGSWSLSGAEGSVRTIVGAIKMTAGNDPNAYVQASGQGTFMTCYGGTISIGYSGAEISSAGGTRITGGLTVSGAKNFVMAHPSRPGMELLHGATESPVSGVEYWGCGTVGADGADVFALPEYFSALVKPDSECVAVYGNGAVVGWGEVVDNSVIVTGPAGTAYTWLVKAERIGGDFEVEREAVKQTTLDEMSQP